MGASLIGCSSTKLQSNNISNDEVVSSAIELATEYCNRKMYKEALEVYNKALTETNDYKFLYNKALVLAYLGLYEEAVSLCQDSFENYPYVISFKKAQAIFYEKMNNWDKVYSIYNEILNLNPYDTETRNKLIKIYSNNGEEEKAIEQATILWNQGYKTLDILQMLKF